MRCPVRLGSKLHRIHLLRFEETVPIDGEGRCHTRAECRRRQRVGGGQEVNRISGRRHCNLSKACSFTNPIFLPSRATAVHPLDVSINVTCVPAGSFATIVPFAEAASRTSAGVITTWVGLERLAA